MTIFFTLFVCVISTIGSKKLFNKWFNHISIYVLSWTLFLVLYEIKLISYIPLSNATWIVIIASYMAFLFGTITIFTSRSLYQKNNNIFVSKKKYNLLILDDNAQKIKILVIVFIVLAFFSAFQHWYVLINKYGDIPTVLLKANLIYRDRVSGEMTGTLPYLYITGYIAVFLSAIYSAYKNNIGFYAVLSILSVILKDLASVGRAGIFVGTLLFIITFFLSKHLLSNDIEEKYNRSNKKLILASIFLVVLILGSMTLVKEFRGTVENFQASSKSLNSMKDVPLLSPSIYLYFSSNVGVLSRYLDHDNEDLLIGENTFLPIYNLISKFDVIRHPKFYPKGYFIPMWTNSATYLRDLHADFGFLGIILFPYLLGLLTTFYWFKLYEKGDFHSLIVLTFLFLIIGFSVFYLITRSSVWLLSFIALLIIQKLVFNKNKIQANVKI